MGKNCIAEVFDERPESIRTIFTVQNKEQDPLIQKILRFGIPLKYVSKHVLEKMVRSESHQSFVAEVDCRPNIDLRSFLSRDEKGIVLMLDAIYDPQNFGSILRSAECFGALSVVYSKNRGAPLTPVVSKASVGASELIDLIEVSNLATTLELFQKSGYFAVTAEAHPDASSLYSFAFPEKTLLIMGSEGKGVQPLLRKKADIKLVIPMHGKIDSLNVSQATAVILSHFCRNQSP